MDVVGAGKMSQHWLLMPGVDAVFGWSPALGGRTVSPNEDISSKLQMSYLMTAKGQMIQTSDEVKS